MAQNKTLVPFSRTLSFSSYQLVVKIVGYKHLIKDLGTPLTIIKPLKEICINCSEDQL